MKEYKTFANEAQLILKPSNVKKAKITSSRDVYEYIKKLILPEEMGIAEHFFALYLNQANNISAWALISKGGMIGTVVDIKAIIKRGIDLMSQSIVIAHNHPSGNLKPSLNDNKLTKKIVDAAKLYDIKVLDHIIFSHDSYLSFLDEGLL